MSTTYRKFLYPLFAAALLVTSAAALTACDDNTAEEAGEKIDEGINDAKRAVEDATD